MSTGAVANPGSIPLNGAPGMQVAQFPINNTVAPVSGTQNTLAPINTTQNNPYAPPTSNGTISQPVSTGVPVGGSNPNTLAPGTTVDGGQVISTSGAGAIPTNDPTGVQNNGINVSGSQGSDASNSLAGDFEDTYGKGTGTAITDVLQNMGTTNDAAIQATISNTDLAAGKEMGNIQAQEAAGGVTPNSSTAALAESNFYTGVNSQLQQTIGQQEVGEENTLLSTLLGEGSAHGTDESGLDSFMNGLGDVGSIGGSIASLAGLL